MSFSPADRALQASARAFLWSPLARRAPGAPSRNDRGDPLDPATQWLLRIQGLVTPGLEADDPVVARHDMRNSSALAAPDPIPVTTLDAMVEGPTRPIPVRHYLPPGHALPTMVAFHGGGWTVGDLDTHDALWRRMAVAVPMNIVSVDYALAPEHPFPEPLLEALAVVDAVRATADGPVGVGGDSAGGHLSALVAQQRDVDFQLLIYPATDLRRLTASHRTLAKGYLLESESIDRYLKWMGADPEDPAASPAMSAPGNAPAVVVTAGFDPLRDEGEAYAQALHDAGIPVTHLGYPQLIHGFVNLDGLLPAADRAVGEIIEALRHVARGRDTV